jgi:hypothetical protein
MLKWAAPILSVMLVVSCSLVNYPGPQDLATQPPPSLDELKAEIDKGFCSGSNDQVSFGLPRNTVERPAPLSGCSAYFPKHFLNTTIQASCGSMFDLDDSGRAINIETRCNVASPRVSLPEDWASVAEQGFIYSITKQLASWRYPAKGAEASGQRRHSIFIINKFGLFEYDFAPKDSPPFQRSGVVPPLPPDLVEKIAEYATDS